MRADHRVVDLLDAAVYPLVPALAPEVCKRLVGLGLVTAELETEEVAEAIGILFVFLAEKGGCVSRHVELAAENLVERTFEHEVHLECKSRLGDEIRLHAAAVRGFDVLDLVVIARGVSGENGGQRHSNGY